MDIAAEVSMFDELLLFSVADGDASRFVHEYHSLAAWVDASLDLYKVHTMTTLLYSDRAAAWDLTERLTDASRINAHTQEKS